MSVTETRVTFRARDAITTHLERGFFEAVHLRKPVKTALDLVAQDNTGAQTYHPRVVEHLHLALRATLEEKVESGMRSGST